MSPYGLVSDQHFHKWSQFFTTLPNGVNSRLQASLNELRRCADELKKAGGNLIVNAGDTFHQRGNLSPEVLNPVMDLHRELIGEGFEIIIIAGNHDLEGKESTRLGSAITALEGVGCRVINEPESFGFNGSNFVMMPWMSSVQKLKERIELVHHSKRRGFDLIIHAPIDGVISGLPDHGLTADWLVGQGFMRVFSGHYHNHKDFGNGVYSIGSTSHLTWSDVSSKAGFLIVSDNDVKWFQSHTPQFIELTPEMDIDDVQLLADGNYVRVKMNTSKMQDINKMREWLTDCGALGIVINTIKEATQARTGTVANSVSAGASIETSISEYIAGKSFSNAAQVQIECQKLLAETGV